MTLFHIFNKCPAIFISIMDRVKKSIIRYFLFFQDCGIPLFCKRICIQDLISTAGSGGERDQDVWLSERKNFTMEFAPALETIRSAAANKCFSGLSTYSY